MDSVPQAEEFVSRDYWMQEYAERYDDQSPTPPHSGKRNQRVRAETPPSAALFNKAAEALEEQNGEKHLEHCLQDRNIQSEGESSLSVISNIRTIEQVGSSILNSLSEDASDHIYFTSKRERTSEIEENVKGKIKAKIEEKIEEKMEENMEENTEKNIEDKIEEKIKEKIEVRSSSMVSDTRNPIKRTDYNKASGRKRIRDPGKTRETKATRLPESNNRKKMIGNASKGGKTRSAAERARAARKKLEEEKAELLRRWLPLADEVRYVAGPRRGRFVLVRRRPWYEFYDPDYEATCGCFSWFSELYHNCCDRIMSIFTY